MNDNRELVSDEEIDNLLETLHVRYWDAPELVKKWLSPILAAAEAKGREKVAAWMIQNGFATGHGDSLDDLLLELSYQVAELRERRILIHNANFKQNEPQP